MRKIFLLLSVILSGCSCLLSQVPPQTIYVDENCEGVIPDYRGIVIASDNCPGLTLEQIPVPGTILSVENPGANVEVIEAQITKEIRLMDGVSKVQRNGYVKVNDGGFTDSIKYR